MPGELRVDPQIVHGCGQAMAALAAGLPPAPVGFSEVQAGDPLSNLKSELMFDAALDADLSLSKTDVAVTTWMGYDRPMDLLQSASPDRAINGGAALATYLDGMHASHVGPAAIDTVIGHSYGSTLVGGAATGGNHLAADNVIAVGSSGMLAQHASDLSLETGAHSSPAARKTTLSVWGPVRPPPGWKVQEAIPQSQQQAQNTVVGYLRRTLAELLSGSVIDGGRYLGPGMTPYCDDNDSSPTAPRRFSTIGQLKLPPGSESVDLIAKVGETWRSWGWYVVCAGSFDRVLDVFDDRH